MKDSSKKTLMIGVIVVCLSSAVLIAYIQYFRDSGGIDSISKNELTWVLCNNSTCKAEYSMSLKNFLKDKKERYNPKTPFVTPALTCKECGKESIYEAVKCDNPNCGAVFHKNSIPGDFSDRCPNCGYSEMEKMRHKNITGK